MLFRSGDLECCESVQSSNDPVVSLLLSLLGIVLGPIGVQVGLTCSPVTVSFLSINVLVTCAKDASASLRLVLEETLDALRPSSAARTTASVGRSLGFQGSI